MLSSCKAGGATKLGDKAPVDIGTPANILLVAFNLPALIALLPLVPLTYWVEIDSEMVVRAVWGLSAVGQWFLIGRYLDRRRGLLSACKPIRRVWINKVLFGIAMLTGGAVTGFGIFTAVEGTPKRLGVPNGRQLCVLGIGFRHCCSALAVKLFMGTRG